MTQLHPCPCCGEETFDERPGNTFIICGNCKWEDDSNPERLDDPGFSGTLTLRQARDNYKQFGICDPGLFDIYPEKRR